MSEDDGVQIPAQFWQSVTEKDFGQIHRRGHLNARECARLWRMLDRTDAPPETLMLRLLAPVRH